MRLAQAAWWQITVRIDLSKPFSRQTVESVAHPSQRDRYVGPWASLILHLWADWCWFLTSDCRTDLAISRRPKMKKVNVSLILWPVLELTSIQNWSKSGSNSIIHLVYITSYLRCGYGKAETYGRMHWAKGYPECIGLKVAEIVLTQNTQAKPVLWLSVQVTHHGP